jgi:hypothetical protein
MEPARLEQLQATLRTDGPAAAIQRLCESLKAEKEYQSLFYALLMKKRHELGVSPIATGNNNDLPPHAQEGFENGIREACRTVGQLYLDDGQVPQAWGYFRMIGEPGPIVQALEKVELDGSQDIQPYIDIAFQQGVLPKKGFDWLLAQYGICSAITTVSAGEMPFPADVRHYCVERLIRTLYGELMERLKGEIKQKQGFEATAKSLPELIAGRDWLFADDFYHIDLSHLNAVIQMAGQLEPGEPMRLARELCGYGKHLSPKFNYQTDPPFENLYVDYEIYLSILLGEDVDKNLDHFRKKAADADPETIGTYPAEVLVNLLLRIGRPKEALEVSRKYLTNTEQRHSCPTFVELCQQSKDYAALAEVAREQGNPVNFMAALLAQAK